MDLKKLLNSFLVISLFIILFLSLFFSVFINVSFFLNLDSFWNFIISFFITFFIFAVVFFVFLKKELNIFQKKSNFLIVFLCISFVLFFSLFFFPINDGSHIDRFSLTPLDEFQFVLNYAFGNPFLIFDSNQIVVFNKWDSLSSIDIVNNLDSINQEIVAFSDGGLSEFDAINSIDESKLLSNIVNVKIKVSGYCDIKRNIHTLTELTENKVVVVNPCPALSEEEFCCVLFPVKVK